MNPTMNLRAALDAEEFCRTALSSALSTYGAGYVGVPRIAGGELESVNQWWLRVGGGESSRTNPNAPVHALDMDAHLEGVFADRQRAWEFAFTAIAALPLRGGIVQTAYLKGNPTNEYEYFVLAGRAGQKHGLWRVYVPLRVVFNCDKGEHVQ